VTSRGDLTSPERRSPRRESQFLTELEKNNSGLSGGKLINSAGSVTLKKEYHEEVMIRMAKIIRKENSLMLVVTEAIANNFDYVFRYIYLVAVILLMSGQFYFQIEGSEGVSYLITAAIISVILIVALIYSIVTKVKRSNYLS